LGRIHFFDASFLSVANQTVVGAALVHEDALVRLSAFLRMM